MANYTFAVKSQTVNKIQAESVNTYEMTFT